MNKTPKVKPFDDNNFPVGGLNVDSSEDRVAISGSVDITRDKEGLALAKTLADYLNKAVATLEKELDAGKLPAKIVKLTPVIKDNPFA